MLVTTLSLSIFYQPIKQRTALVQLANMGNNSDKLYVTHSEHAGGSHTASSFGKRQETGKSEFQRLPLYVLFPVSSAYDPRNLIMCVCVWYSDCCALSLQPFRNPVAVISETKAGEAPRADVFDLLNIVPYIRKFKSSKWPKK